VIKIWILTSQGVKPCGLIVVCHSFMWASVNSNIVWEYTSKIMCIP